MFRSSLPEAEAAHLRSRHPCSNTMQQHHAATPCTYRRISSINASFYLICIGLTPCEREKLCISIVFKHLTYAYRANFSRTANKLIEAQLSGSQQRASHGAMPRTASRKRRNKGAGQEALGLEPRDRTRGVRATAVSSQKEPGPKECQDPRAPDPRAATVPTPKAGAAIATTATDPGGRGAVAATVSTPRARGRRAAAATDPGGEAAVATAATDPRGRGVEPTRRVMQSRRTQWQPASPRIQSQGAPKPPLFRTGTAPDSHLLPMFHNAYMNR